MLNAFKSSKFGGSLSIGKLGDWPMTKNKSSMLVDLFVHWHDIDC